MARKILSLQLVIVFLALIVGAASVAPRYDTRFGIWRDGTIEPTTREVADFARRMDAALDRLPPMAGLVAQGDLVAYALEILPYFNYEGLVPQPVIPIDLGWFWWPNNRMFHVAGVALCGNYGPPQLALNLRFSNVASPWYGQENLSTLVHELVHVQGGTFCSGESADLEANTQIATIEVLAAMANDGNALALRSLLYDLRGMALGTLRYFLPEAEYEAFRWELLGNEGWSRYEKQARAWARNPSALQDVLNKYSVVPLNALWHGIEIGQVERVQVRTQQDSILIDTPLRVDDLQWLLLNLDRMVGIAGHA